MKLAGVETKLVDRLQPDRAAHPVRNGRQGLQGPTEPIIVELLGEDSEHLLHRKVPRPLLDLIQRRTDAVRPQRRAQSVGNQGFDHLPVGQPLLAFPHGAPAIHRLRDLQATAEAAVHLQGAQHLHHLVADLRPWFWRLRRL